MKCSLLVLLSCMLLGAQPTPLTNQRITELSSSGVSQPELIRLIQSAPSVSFDLTPTGNEALMKAGVSEDVIKAMAAREQSAPIYTSTSPFPAPKPEHRVDAAGDFIQRGSKDFGFNGTIIIPHVATDATTGFGSFRAGYYIGRSSLVGADASLLAEADAQAYILTGFYRYVQHTRNERLYPYAGVGVGAIVGHVSPSLGSLAGLGTGTTESRFALKAEAGVKYFITRNVSFDTAYNLLYAHIDPLTFKQSSASLIVLGLSFTF